MAQLFFENSSKKVAGMNVGTMLGRKEKKGDIGIEIEVEGVNLPKTQGGGNPFGAYLPTLIPKGWSYHHDGSLRGQENAEYVLSEPVKFNEVPGMINALWDMFSKAESKLDVSNRTSVHVHLNMQRFFLNRLAAFTGLYFSVEEVLTQWAGEHRIGNLFCLRAKDAPSIVTKLKQFIRTDGGVRFTDGFHYSGLNAQALEKFGSMEVRSLRGCTNPQEIIDWVAVLQHIYDLSGQFNDPRDIPPLFSSMGSEEYFNFVVGPLASKIKNDTKLSHSDLSSCLLEGIRMAQDICYCRDWSEYVPAELKPDPFGRSSKKVVQSVSSVLSGPTVINTPTGAAAPSGDDWPSWMIHDEYEEEVPY